MTKPEDKLVAISGLAREVQEFTKDLYCAGLWRKDLTRQLVWRMQKPQIYRQKEYRAPTWSWASVDGRVIFLANGSYQITSEVTILSVRALGLNSKPYPFGQVSYGYLRLRGTLKAAQLGQQRGGTCNLSLTDELDEAQQITNAEFYPDMVLGRRSEKLQCLPVLSCRNYEDISKKEDYIRFLVGLVITSTGEFPGEYRRVGTFQIPNIASREWSMSDKEHALQDITII